MAVKATAKKHQGRESRIECRVIGVRSAFKARSASFDLGSSPIWKTEGSFGSKRLSPRALDLLDLVGGIYRIESQISPRPTNPVKEWQIHAPVRDVKFWAAEGGAHLASVLGFLNRALWTFAFASRPKTDNIVLIPDQAKRIKEVLLFSGGMDSACGAGIHSSLKEQVQLVSFCHTNQRSLQLSLAGELGYAPPTQWRLFGQRGKEGMNLIRSLMFLALGAVVAETFGASRIFQYENGVLGMAIPPSGNFVPTRHAHPELHRRLEGLFEAVFGRAMEIHNPFALDTKREEAEHFAKIAGPEKSETILRRTQTCWRLAQARVGSRSKIPWVPCGICTPCIVRRTARPHEASKGAWKGWSGYAFDLKKPSIRNNEKLGLSFRAFLELIDVVRNATTDREIVDDLAPEGRELVGGPAGPSEEEAARLLRKFATEFCETFDIPLSSSLP